MSGNGGNVTQVQNLVVDMNIHLYQRTKVNKPFQETNSNVSVYVVTESEYNWYW